MVSLIQTDLYLIRHGIAADRGTYLQDEDRPLVPKGIHKTQQVAQRLKNCGVTFSHILTSPLIRAQQTAEIFQAAQLCPRVETFPALAPAGNLQDFLTWLATHRSILSANAPDVPSLGAIALVGHEPDLSHWAQCFIQGQSNDRWTLKKAGIIGITVPDVDNALGNSHLFLLIPPRFFL